MQRLASFTTSTSIVQCSSLRCANVKPHLASIHMLLQLQRYPFYIICIVTAYLCWSAYPCSVPVGQPNPRLASRLHQKIRPQNQRHARPIRSQGRRRGKDDQEQKKKKKEQRVSSQRRYPPMASHSALGNPRFLTGGACKNAAFFLLGEYAQREHTPEKCPPPACGRRRVLADPAFLLACS